MSSKKCTLLVLFVMIVSAGAVMTESECTDAASIYTVEGVLGLDSEAGTSIPAEGVEVGIYASDKSPLGDNNTATTNDQGEFSLSIETGILNNLLIHIYKEGYSVRPLPSFMDPYPEEGWYKIDLTACTDGNVCTLSKDLMHCIPLSDTNVPLSIYVSSSSDNRVLKGATVTIYHDGMKKYTGETDSSGLCKTDSKLPIGDYVFEVTCPGYKFCSVEKHITATDTSVFVMMNAKEISTYGGMTVYHIFMVAGVGIGFILTLAGYILCRHDWSHVDEGRDD